MRHAVWISTLAVGLFPALVCANSASSPVKYAGAAADGGQTCVACHNTYAQPNSDPAGDVGGMTINAPASYQPGQKYLIQVEVFHPNASRWGFELTARIQDNPAAQAGSLAQNSDVQVKCGDAPNTACSNGAVQFATQIAASTRAGQTTSAAWTVEWTAPSTDVGAVVFYGTTVAANNNNNVSGDRTYAAQARSVANPACNLTLQPTLLQIVNAAADLRVSATSSQRVSAPNSLISLFGSGFAPNGAQGRAVGLGELSDSGFPKSLSCIAVEVAGGPRLPITFLNATQINAQLPAKSAGPVSLRVLVNPDTPNQIASQTATINVIPVAPAFFTLGGSNSIAALNDDNTYLASGIAGAKPAKPGQVAVLFATGLGVTKGAAAEGQIPSGVDPAAGAVSLTIGGINVPASDILYAGVTPGSISGLYQINVRLPANLPAGNAPVVLTMGGVSSQAGAFVPVQP